MLHLFAWLPGSYRLVVLAFLFAATVIFALILSAQGRPLRTDAAPQGILSYEFAWNRVRASRILESWRSITNTAKEQLRLDFGFLVVYPLLLALACAMLAESPSSASAPVGLFISWAVLAAGPLDAAENVLLWRMLDHGAEECLARLAAWCAGLKFVLVYSGAGYIVLQGLAVLVGRIRAA